jgi:hypothetical protein
MKFLDLLRKLGILRYGAVGGTYKSYKDRPDELMFDNVYDKKKDLTTKEDLKDIAKTVKGDHPKSGEKKS